MSRKIADVVALDMIAFKPQIMLRGYQEKSIQALIDHLRSAYPLLFHLGEVRYEIYDNGVVMLFPEYEIDSDTYKCLIDQVEVKVTSVKEGAMRCSTELMREKYIHDLLCKQVSYSDDGKESHSLIGPLLKGRGVCEGIAKAAQVLLKSVGIEAYLVAGTAKSGEKQLSEPHAWNVVRIDNKWYHLDVTFDTTLSGEYVRYDYFNLDSEAIACDHSIEFDPMGKAAFCKHPDDIFVVSGRVFENDGQVRVLFQRLFQENKKFVQFRMTGSYHERQNKIIIREWENAIAYTNRNVCYTFSVNKQRNVYAFQVVSG